MNSLATIALMGDTKAAQWSCSQYLPWKRKRVFEAELQKYGAVLYGHRLSIVEICVLFLFVFDDGDGWVHWYICK